MTPHQEYVRRAAEASLLTLAPLHHQVMDSLFTDFADGFCFDDVYLKQLQDLSITGHASMAGNPNRVKLVVIRALEGLVAVGMLQESVIDQKCYHFVWSPQG